MTYVCQRNELFLLWLDWAGSGLLVKLGRRLWALSRQATQVAKYPNSGPLFHPCVLLVLAELTKLVSHDDDAFRSWDLFAAYNAKTTQDIQLKISRIERLHCSGSEVVATSQTWYAIVFTKSNFSWHLLDLLDMSAPTRHSGFFSDFVFEGKHFATK